MNILILGSGGREHAISWKLAQSKNASNLFISPGNAGTSTLGKNIALADFNAIAKFILSEKIEMLVVGPEQPLVEGIVDFLKSKKEFERLNIIGPCKEAAKLEGSKEYAKKFMLRHKVPTAKYQSFTAETIKDGNHFLESLSAPYVLKADGLAAGKGVLILNELEEAKKELSNMLIQNKFGEASNQVVIEEFLSGIEMSVFVLTDGKDYKILPEAKDYKRIGEKDTGLNTGGMGAVSPVPFANKELLTKIENNVVIPSVKGLEADGLDYKGFLFIGLMIVNNEPFVIEYNVRMGDPETEVVMPRIKSDLVSHLKATAEGNISNETIDLDNRSACTVMMVSGGYPEAYEKGKEINGIEQSTDSIVFHAGTKIENGKTLTNGGRVLAITSLGENFKEAVEKSYFNADKISFEDSYYRRDIGFDL